MVPYWNFKNNRALGGEIELNKKTAIPPGQFHSCVSNVMQLFLKASLPPPTHTHLYVFTEYGWYYKQ